MLVKCISNKDNYDCLTIGKAYNAEHSTNVEGWYSIINDWNVRTSYKPEMFGILKEESLYQTSLKALAEAEIHRRMANMSLDELLKIVKT